MVQLDLVDIFHERGYFHQCTDEQGLKAAIVKNPSMPFYVGFDCTAATLHVGSLLQIMIVRQAIALGMKPVILLGGGTTKIGDPSGKDESRNLQTNDAIDGNLQGIKKVICQFVSEEDVVFVNNDDWLGELGYISFLRDVGRLFSVNKMLTFESVKRRLDREQHLSFLEFNYMLLQAYDFVELYKRHGCRLQFGGSDQWGNIVSGIELARKMEAKEELFGITSPLITTSTGAKMGKTADGAVWLSAEDLSAYDYWQFWRNVDDADVIRFLKLFTELPLSKIDELSKLQGQDINEAKIILANEATTLCHGKDAADAAQETAKKTFEQGGLGGDIPTYNVSVDELTAGVPVYKLFHMAGLCESGGAARRLMKGNGAKINDQPHTDPEAQVTSSWFEGKEYLKLSAGKKKHVKVILG
tara:strand:- start:105 stop:1346 length:1242 start_codon:yes stop_codon:yes gene_type:complete